MSTPNQPPAEFIDRHMISNVEGVMIHEYLKRRPGGVPNKEELSAFVSGLNDVEVLTLVRTHPSLRSLHANMRNDADVLRWVHAIK